MLIIGYVIGEIKMSVYVIITLQDTTKAETKTFRNTKALIDYCFNVHKANYVVFEESFDASFDYFVKLRDQLK